MRKNHSLLVFSQWSNITSPEYWEMMIISSSAIKQPMGSGHTFISRHTKASAGRCVLITPSYCSIWQPVQCLWQVTLWFQGPPPPAWTSLVVGPRSCCSHGQRRGCTTPGTVPCHAQSDIVRQNRIYCNVEFKNNNTVNLS